SLDLGVDNLAVKGSCAIRDIHSGDPRITAQATTSRFRLEEFGGYVPYGIIVKGTADFIEQHIKGGTYKLDDGKLDGRVSQIVHMERGDNYNVLSIFGKVEKGIVNYGRSIPAFTNIKGELELRGKDFSLHRMSGTFGSSPFTLDGKITDYPLDTPSGYPFTMYITPRPGETSWLFGWLKEARPVVNGESRVHLVGEGTTSEYRLSGEWDLTTASYSYTDLISKPAGRASTVSFRGTVTGQEAKFNLIQLNLPPLALSTSGVYRFADKPGIALDIRSNQFHLNELASMVPLAKKYQAGGRVQANVHAAAEGSELTGVRWSGAISLAGFTCKPAEQVKTVSNVNGSIIFNGTRLETSQLAVRLGNSTIYGKGSLDGFKNPTINLVFSSPLLDMADLGLHSPDREVRIGKLYGDVSLKDDDLKIRTLSGRVANTSLSVTGNVLDLSNPQVDIAVTSPHLEVADILPLTALERVKKGEGPSPRLSLKATVSADTGKIGEVDFSGLTTVLMYEDKILYLQPVECSLLGGRLSARGRADFTSPLPRTQASFNLSKVSAERFLKAMGVQKQEITGKLSLQGELTAKGKEAADIKKTVLGSVRLHCEEGTIRRFAVLSKIFSILNVSQLLKFQLPDMVSGGMPYNHLSATFSFRDGIVSTSDLYLASNAMNISAVGKVDLAKDEIDATIGVQPLQTIDKVVSRIPIVGWLLTGKDRSLISAYFEAKGKLDNPKVAAIPVKSMAKGVFDIFKRIFELPAKLFTDTGEVIINK
ncbi:MAG TPA: AsmA-like C-terminal domain-containing protein, partial [Geobacteraceae bacterium]